jgi:hypothetical protein
VLGARYATRNGFCPAANDIGSHPGLQIELVERHQVGAFPQTGEARTQDKCMASPGRPTVDRGPRKLAPDFVADAATARDMSDDVVKMTTKVTNSIIPSLPSTKPWRTPRSSLGLLGRFWRREPFGRFRLPMSERNLTGTIAPR